MSQDGKKSKIANTWQDSSSSSSSSSSNPKPIWRNIVSAALQYDFLDSMAWQIHRLKDDAIWSNPISTPTSSTTHNDPTREGRSILEEKEDDEKNNTRESLTTTEGLMYERFGDNFARRMSWEESISSWKKSLDFYENIIPTHHRQVATLFNKIGIAHYVKDDLYLSYESFQQALRIQEATLDPGDEEISVTLKNIWIVRVRMKEKMGDSTLSRELLMLHVMNTLLVKLPTG